MDLVPGIYRHEDLIEFGLTAKEVHTLVGSKALERLRRGWFATGGHDSAVAEAVRSGGALSCVSALKWHGLWVSPGYPDTHVRRSRKLAASKGVGCRPYKCMPAVTAPVDPVALALECALHCMSEEDWIAACDSACNKLSMTAESMRAEMGALTKEAKRWVDKVEPKSQSGTESIARVRLRALGFIVVVQPEIKAVGRSDLRIGRLIIECDSKSYHLNSETYQYDRQRDRKATKHGWLRFRLTYDDILYGWTEVLEDIRFIIRRDQHRVRGRAKLALEKSMKAGAATLILDECGSPDEPSDCSTSTETFGEDELPKTQLRER